jgi:signal transduction histidine kinase/ligand-binding sensor domain-containing protein
MHFQLTIKQHCTAFARKIVLTILTLAFLSTSAICQVAGIRHYTITDGIAGMNTYMCFQDSKGYIWIATSEGVSRFDGTTFANFTRKEGLPDNDILRIYEDPFQRIWFLSFNGHLSFYSLKDNTIHNASTDKFIKNLYVGAGFENMFVDSKKRIWFSSIGNKLALLDGEQVQHIDLSDLITRDCISVSEDTENNINLYSGFNKLKFDNSKNTFVIKDAKIEGSVTTFFGYKPGIDCFANQKYIGRIESGEMVSLLEFSETDIKKETYNTSTLHDSLLIISTTNSGVHVYELLPVKRKVYQFSVDCNFISSILDKENNLWIATRNDGVYMLSQSFRSGNYYNPQIFGNKKILSICKIGPTSFVIGGTDNSLFLLENQKIRKINFRLKDNTEIGSISDIYLDPFKNIWLSCDYGILKTSVQDIENGDALSGIVFDKISIYKFNSIQISSDGNGVASTSLKLYRIKIDKYSKAQIFVDTTFKATGIRILQSFSYDKNSILYSKTDGFYHFKNKISQKYRNINEIISSIIIDISLTSDSTITLATDGDGLLFMKDEKIVHHVTTKNGLPSMSCRKVRHMNDTVLVCTNKGLAFFSYRNDTYSYIGVYSDKNGLPSNEVKDVSYDSENYYVVTGLGLAVVPKSLRISVSKSPDFYISEIKNYRDEKINFNGIQLSNKNNFLKVKYSAVTFTQQEDVVYQYKFNNSTDWSSTKLTELIFPDLSGGSYTLQLRAKKGDSDWSKIETLHFSVDYPFYLSWWFIAASLILTLISVSLIIIYLSRRRNRQLMLLMEKKSALNHERNRISADMHDDVGSDLSKISISIDFSKHQMDAADPAFAQLDKISGYAYAARKKMDDIIWALNPENDNVANLVAYLNKYGLDYFSDTSVTFRLINEIPEGLNLVFNAKQRRNIFLIVKELCTNTFKHSEASNFTVTIKMDRNQLIINTKDDGKGIANDQLRSRGNGLQNIRKRASEIDCTMKMESSAGQGTQYQFLFKNIELS